MCVILVFLESPCKEFPKISYHLLFSLAWLFKINTIKPTSVSTENQTFVPPTPGFYLLRGRGEASPQTSQLPHPPKSFTEKNLQLFQIKIFFDDNFKESVKVTNVQKCDFSQS